VFGIAGIKIFVGPVTSVENFEPKRIKETNLINIEHVRIRHEETCHVDVSHAVGC